MKESVLHDDLVRECQNGRRSAQAKLYGLYSRAMYNICLRMVNNQMDAEDILQNSFIDVFLNLHKFRFDSTIGAWIKRIVINNCINFLRKKKIYFEEVNETILNVKEEPIGREALDVSAIDAAIKLLPDGYRVVLSLYLLEGYDHKEIGEILGVSTSTSKSQYSRAKVKLKQLLSGHFNYASTN